MPVQPTSVSVMETQIHRAQDLQLELDLVILALTLNGVLVFFMQAGFAFLEAGAVRA